MGNRVSCTATAQRLGLEPNLMVLSDSILLYEPWLDMNTVRAVSPPNLLVLLQERNERDRGTF